MRPLLLPCALLLASPLNAQSVDSLHPVMQAGAPRIADSASGPTWDMDVRSYESQDRVQYYIGLFTGKARERITERLDRGSRYESMIRSALRAGGVPEDMYYLALIESGFDPNAYSKAAAVGMWQFMTGTARDLGLHVDWWIDERRDPVRSTVAAVRFIRDLQSQFKSLYLAAAAYNGGPGRVQRGLTKYANDLDPLNSEDAFFLLADKNQFKGETRNYVPQLIASALIAKEPAKYGMELHAREAFVYDSVRVGRATPLAAIAKAANSNSTLIAELNPHILRGMTSPKDSMFVRIPTGSAALFDSAFAEIAPVDLVALRRVETKKGDSPTKIANGHGISLASLRMFNPKMKRLKSGNLASGQVLQVPAPAVAAMARDVPDPSIEKYPKTRRVKAKSRSSTVKRGVAAKSSSPTMSKSASKARKKPTH
jgi:membrane-bound lytic murein transglycosylase D